MKRKPSRFLFFAKKTSLCGAGVVQKMLKRSIGIKAIVFIGAKG